MKQFLLVSATLLCASAVQLFGQAPVGTLSGVVTDPSGGIVKAARVTVTDKQRASHRNLQTDSVGAFAAPSLLGGLYEVRVEALGFRMRCKATCSSPNPNTTAEPPAAASSTSTTTTPLTAMHRRATS